MSGEATARGYTIRPPCHDDLTAVFELQVACDIDELRQADTTMADIGSQWGRSRFDLQRDAWVAVDRGDEMVGYAWVEDRTRNVDVEADVVVRPAHRDGDLGGRLLERVGGGGGAPPDAHAFLGILCAAANEWKQGLLLGQGYAPERALFRMRIDLTGTVRTAPLPDGLELRTFVPTMDAEAVHAALDEAFLDEAHPRRESQTDWEERLLRRPDFDPSLWLVARDGTQIAGVAAAYDFGDIGWVQGLGVRRPWRRRGLGLGLLTSVFSALWEHGQPTVCLGVDSDSETGATRLYERARMRVDQRWILYRKALEPAQG